MKLMYVIALSGFLLGLALLTYSTVSGGVANIFGLIVHSRVLRAFKGRVFRVF